MKSLARNSAAVLIVSLFSCGRPSVAQSAARDGAPAQRNPVRLSQHERTVHLLDRLTFGPQLGDVERVERIGADKWIDQQLHPEKIDDSALENRLDQLPAMRMSTVELLRRFPPNVMIRMVENGRMSLPADPVERVIYENELANYRKQRERQQTKQAAESGTPAKPARDLVLADNNEPQMAVQWMGVQSRVSADDQQADAVEGQRLLALSPEQRWRTILQEQPGRLRPIVQKMKPADRLALISGFSMEQREDLTAMVNVNRVIADELMQEKVLRAIYSKRQLNEVMTDFWFNHFNVYLRKNGEMPWLLATYERDVIRPRALGKFEDLLQAVAHSPAMLVYLDNQQSIGPHSQAALNAYRNRTGKNGPPGLNENYARELMELHTLGVNGGYTQKDVTEVAKVFTGWGIEQPGDGFGFRFDRRRHEPGTKVVLGKAIAENGEVEGDDVLHLLATRPATAKLIATALAMQFVSDDPPPALVNRMAKRFLKSKGDIREVLREMVKSPEFWATGVYRAKVKTPFEYVVSAMRTTNADVEDATPLARSLEDLGMPLYGVQQPNGYSLKADPWLGTEALLARMNFAMALTRNKLPGVTMHLPVPDEDDAARESRLETQLLEGAASEGVRATVLEQMEKIQIAPGGPAQARKTLTSGVPVSGVPRFGVAFPERASLAKQAVPGDSKTAVAAALLLGSPDFQRR